MRESRDLIVRSLCEEEFPQAWQVLRSGVGAVPGENVAPGFVAGLWLRSRPEEIRLCALGSRRLLPTVQPMQIDTIFDLASVSKVYGAATLAALLVDRRWLSWETPVRAVLPDFRHPEIRLRHLLSHTAGFAAWEPYWERIRARFSCGELAHVPVSDRQQAMRELILAADPEAKPGERALYSDISFLLLGFMLEEVTGMALDRAVPALLWEALGVSRSSYRRVVRGVIEAVDEQVAATEFCAWRGGVLQGQVHDDNTWAMGGYAGHAGAFGDARDLLHFSRRLLGGFLSRDTLRGMWSRVSEPVGCERTLGWDTPSGEAPSASLRFSRNSVGHLGFTGTSLWIDPEAGLAAVLLSNRVHPSRENTRIRAFRPRFHEALKNDLESLPWVDSRLWAKS